MRSVRVAENFDNKRFKKSYKPLFWKEIDQSINKTRKSPLFLHAPMVPLCLTIAVIPQFRSIIPCEKILYVEMSLGTLYIEMRLFGVFWTCLSIKSPTQVNGEV